MHEIAGAESSVIDSARDYRRTKQDNHDGLSWTACYEDNCTMHRSDKDGSDGGRRSLRLKRYACCALKTPEPNEESGSHSIEGNSEESVASEDDEQGISLAVDNSDLMEFAIGRHGEALQMFQEIARRYEEVFPESAVSDSCSRISSRYYCNAYARCHGEIDSSTWTMTMQWSSTSTHRWEMCSRTKDTPRLMGS